ncbi:MAG TPA: hypothetical protein VI685_28155 [Candidatus Angelobacter sp.]
MVAMIKRGRRSEFPAFFNFVLWNCLATAAFQTCPRFFPQHYETVYWFATAVSMLLSLWIFYEAFVTILKPYSGIIDLGKILFWWAAVFLFVAGLVTALSTSGSHYSKMCAVILLLEHCVQLMQCGMLLLLLAFESRLGISWRGYPMCIGLGLGLFAAWDLTGTYLLDRFPAWQNGFDILNNLVVLGTYSYWLIALLLPAPERKTAADSPSRLILQRWNEVLLTTPLVARKNQAVFSPVESFLPGVEQTVERVMARKMMH